ncbi:trimeric LpxA-like protein [Tricharina praecox]|uniref:trimeric LpxA-like protein n=1 Tax=Tricharina praecox TaxID=43433 RepID=UPI00221EA2DE|nr:trimeric LpxA-like protein [Tricharina praecox]KAI5859075.1 trimeric LpxA-like protein [Tricharina praecox]
MAPRSRLAEAALPKPPTILSSTLVISEHCAMVGTHPVKIGNHTVIHPRCRLNSTLGPITIGDYCILNERTQITPSDSTGITIDDHVVVETNAVVEARSLGEGCTVEVGAKIGKRANCKFTPLTVIADDELVEDDTVVWGFGARRKDMSGSKEARLKSVEKQVEALRGVVASNRTKFLS